MSLRSGVRWLWPSLALGVAWVAVPLVPLPPFTAHMIAHMVLVAVAAPLFALALADGPRDPVRRAPRWFSPVAVSMLEFVVVWAWHAPALHGAAADHAALAALEQAMFLTVGAWLWLSAIGGGRALRRQRLIGGVTGLLLTSMHMTLLGALLVVSHQPLYRHGGHTASALAPVHDQQLGGAVMLVLGGACYLAGALALITTAFRERKHAPA